MAGNMTAENCANFFASDYTQASSQYTIGSDGHIALSVEEKNRSWCSSSNANDQRAVTIEVANLTTSEPFPVSAQAWNALVDLCTDVCQRNSIKELKWKADKTLIGQPDKQNITVHRWFTNNRSCLPIDTKVLRRPSKDAVYVDDDHTVSGDWITLEDIQLNDEILSVNDNGEIVGWYPVLDKIEIEPDRVYEFQCGLTATGDHKLLVKRSPTESTYATMSVDEILDEMDKIGTSFYVPFLDPTVTDIPLGNITRTYSTEVSCVTVSSGYIFIKQNDKKFYVGNCPGEYMYSRMGQLASEVNAKLKAKSQELSTTTTNNLTKMTNEEFVQSYLKGKQLNDYAICAIMGCMQAESGFIPNNLENTKEKTLNLTDTTYTLAVDKGAYPNFAKDGAGYGLCQWTYSVGKQRLLDFARQRKKSVGDLYTQCEFFWWDLNNNFKNLKTKLVAAKSVAEALRAFLDTYEYGGHAPDNIYNKRLEYATKFYNKYAVKTTTIQTTSSTGTGKRPDAAASRKVPYLVRVEVGELRIREKPSINSTIKGSIKDKSIYTIVEEAKGVGTILWGRLKSGAGWIALDYTSFVRNV